MNLSTALRRRGPSSFTAARSFFSSSPPPTPPKSNKPPLLWKPESCADDHHDVNVQLLSWGRGSSGQLGGGAEGIRLYPTPVANLLLPPSFCLSPTPGSLSSQENDTPAAEEVGIACGLFHSSLFVDGKFWIWGKGDGGRLGGYGGFGALGHTVFTRELTPRLVEGSWSGKIKHISTSGTHTAAITESGELYTWGREEGDGRLGLGPGRGPDQTGGLSIPSKVKALSVPVAAVSCGGFFTMAITEEGQLWNWGANSNYELGRCDKVGGWQPRPVANLEGVRIIQVAAGGYHSLALTDDGEVLSWGHGGHGQLGHSSIQNEKVPKRIDALADKKIVFIACGGSSSAAITEDGKLYMWGNSKDSQLGVPGLPEVQKSPIEVKFLVEDDGLGPHKVLSVAIGASHTMCLASRSNL
ncbi:hypothetical protein V2J09_013596 [Rumex salicifolius]